MIRYLCSGYWRVRKGAKALDAYWEKNAVCGQDRWFDRVDTNKLKMENCSLCVLGQVFGSYWEGLRQLDNYRESRKSGFILERDKRWWVQEIERRRRNVGR